MRMYPLVRDRNKRRCTLIILDGELVDELQTYAQALAAIHVGNQISRKRTGVVAPVLACHGFYGHVVELIHDALHE